MNNRNTTCKGCDSSRIELVFQLEKMPPVNLFLESKNDIFEKYPLDVFFCHSCSLLQLNPPVPAHLLFSHYQHLSSASNTNLQHLQNVSDLLKKISNSQSRILEIGSNDGSLLKFIKKWSKLTVGVDPAQNLIDVSQSSAHFVYPIFFNEETALQIKNKYSEFDQIVALNVVAHTSDFISLLRGVNLLLAKNGIFIFEFSNVSDTVLQGQFDTVYHEHAYYFSAHSIQAALEKTGFQILDIEKLKTQGGSLRIFATHRATSKKIFKNDLLASADANKSLIQILNEEQKNGINDVQNYKAVQENIHLFKDQLSSKIIQYKNKKFKIIGLGAPARGIVILNTLNLPKDTLEFVIDDTPEKQNKFIPLSLTPILDWNTLKDKPKCQEIFLLLSWNYKDEVLKKLKKFRKNGKIIIPFPEIQELDF